MKNNLNSLRPNEKKMLFKICNQPMKKSHKVNKMIYEMNFKLKIKILDAFKSWAEEC